MQTIAVPEQRFARYRRTRDFIQQTIFPGWPCPRWRRSPARSRASRLQINGVEEIGSATPRTLREWRETFEHVDEVRALGYDERFVRIWVFYLSFCEAGFAIRSLRNMQIVLSHSANDALPAFPSVRPGY